MAYALASLVGISVPRCALCKHPRTEETLFASEAATISSGVDRLLGPRFAVNSELMADVIAFDTWIGNWDRNPGSLVAEVETGHKDTRVRLFAIDFEKSEVLRGRSFIVVTAINPAECWPHGDLTALCVGLALPRAQIARIRRVERASVAAILSSTAESLNRNLERADAIIHQLLSRSARIEELTTEVWHD
jgi:hypothetical protein